MIRCPHCQKAIDIGFFSAELGRRTSPLKKRTSAENGKKGGRPPKAKGKKP